MTMTAHECFSRSVPEADRKFVEAAQYAGAHVESFAHPLTDPAGETLHTSVAWIGPRDATEVALYTSGTHGNEGWAGSAIQIDSLRRGAFSELPADRAVMLIHLVNPWGCAWGCRENEENQDLFRDFIYYRPEDRYDDSAYTQEMYEATTLRSYDDEEVDRSNREIGRLVQEMGLAELIGILRRGQWRYPDGLFFNAGGRSWSFRLYRDLVVRYLGHAPRVLGLDIHTAFGRYGEGLVYLENSDNEAKRRLLAEIYGEDRLFVGGSDPAIPAHAFFPYEIGRLFVPGLELVGTAVEFGTVDLDDPVGVMRYVNYLFNRGDPSNPERPDLLEQYARFVYPDEDDWREMVTARGREVVDQTLAGVSELRNHRLPSPVAAEPAKRTAVSDRP
ncbi:MAG TPA: DUF2817 domain-containing protein [Acidimicrobiales bacterium]|nr:DUF2817 domain-containing protein [Acidimicrobiales bacterium]